MKLSLLGIIEILGLLKHEPYQLLSSQLVLGNGNGTERTNFHSPIRVVATTLIALRQSWEWVQGQGYCYTFRSLTFSVSFYVATV